MGARCIPHKMQERFTLRATAGTAGPQALYRGATVGNPPVTLP
jgi:hypothetical protein